MKALLIVDVQNDFLPDGALPVKNGQEVVPLINQLQTLPFHLITASKDWHLVDHSSFAINHKKSPGEKIILNKREQILWPIHCVQGTQGAEFSPELDTHLISKIFYKGIDKEIDSYSAFFDNGHFKSTGLEAYLHEKEIKEVYIVGLATDYCVKYSVLDALNLGFKVFVIIDACRAVNLNDKDNENSLVEMKKSGAILIESKEVTEIMKKR